LEISFEAFIRMHMIENTHVNETNLFFLLNKCNNFFLSVSFPLRGSQKVQAILIFLNRVYKMARVIALDLKF